VVDLNNDNAPASRFWSKLNLISEVTTIMSDNPPSRTTLQEVLGSIREIIPFSSAVLYFYNSNESDYKKELAIGPAFNPAEILMSDSTRKFSDWAPRQEKYLLLTDTNDKKRLAGSGLGALLALPLRIKNNPVGLICLGHGDPEFFREQDIRLLQMLSQQIAISRERSLNQQELRNRNEELEKAQKLLRLAQQRLIDDERLYAVKELSASINHEINNPLSIIVGNVQCLLFVEKNLNEKVIERLNRIETEAMRIAEINHRLLEIDDLVSETYINSGTKLKMLNIEKSSSGVANE